MLHKIFAAFLLVCSMSALAEAQYSVIHGYVIIPPYKHSDDFEVLLNIRDAQQTIAHANVSFTGEYMFRNLDSGDFDLVVRLDGFREARNPIRVSSAPFMSANIILIPDFESRRRLDTQAAYTDALLDEYAKALDETGRKHPDLAVTHLERVVKEIPDFYDAHINLGVVYQDLFRRDEAEKEFRKAHELNADSSRPLVALGRLFVVEAENEILSASNLDVIQLKLAQAREVLNEAIVLDPKLASGFYYLGAVEFLSASYMDAEKQLNHTLELDPDYYAAQVTLTNVYIEQSLWQSALDSVDTFLLRYPDSPFRQQAMSTRAAIIRRLQTR